MARLEIVVLDAGVVQQVGSPMDHYNNPANLFVAGYIGTPKMNRFPVAIRGYTQGGAPVGSDDANDVPMASKAIGAD